MAETWILNNALIRPETTITLCTNPDTYTIMYTDGNTETFYSLTSSSLSSFCLSISDIDAYMNSSRVVSSERGTRGTAYSITFSKAPTGDALTWLQANAEKQSGITDLTGYIWRANEYISPTNINFNVEGSVKNIYHTPYNFVEFNYNSDYGVDIFAFYYSNISEPYTTGDGFVYIPQNSLGFEDGWYFGNTSDMSSYVMVTPPIVKFTGGSDVANTDLISWLQDNGTLSLLDTTMWQLNSTPDLSTDLDISIDYYRVSWNTCEYYDNGEVKITAWSFNNIQVSSNGYILWIDGIPNFVYFYNSMIFDAVVAQFEAQGFTIDQSDITSKSGYFYIESISETEGKLHNVRSDVIRFNSDDWDNETDFINWLGNSAEKIDEYIISNDVVEIGLNAFHSCISFDTIEIPDSVTSIGDYAFYGCSSLANVIILNSVTSIGKEAFWGCSSLTNVTIGNSVTSIGNGAFEDCDSLTSVTIGNGVTSIGEWAFAGCHSLTNVTIPNGVTSILEYAFFDCSSLTSVRIGNSVTSIGERTFSSCSSLTSVTIEAIVPPVHGSNVFYGTNDCPIYVPLDSVSAYKTDWSEYADRIQAIPTPPVTDDLTGWAWLGDTDSLDFDNSGTFALDFEYNDKNYSSIQITSKGLKFDDELIAGEEEPPMPTKGQLITMNLDGSDKQYRVLKTDGTNAEVLAMFDLNTLVKFDSGGTNTYSGKELDTYLNTTWYNTLTATAQDALVSKTLTQYQYFYNSIVYNETTHASYADYSTKSVKESGLSRKVYAIDFEDIEEYFNHTFSTADIHELFWNVRTVPSNYTNPWTRSASSGNTSRAWYVNGFAGYVDISNANYTYAARPAFTIDLSKISWS